MRTSPASTSSPASPAAACTGAITDRAVDRRAAAAPLRLRAVGAEQERPAAGRHRDREQGGPGARSPISFPDQPFIRTAPAFLVFLANGRRLPEISKMRGKPFPNDHLDQFFNAAVDAGIVLATLHPRRRRGRARHLPDQRDPRSFGEGERDARAAAAGHPGRRDERRLAVGGGPHQRRGCRLSSTVHDGQYDEGDLAARIDAYDRRRAAIHPYKPRDPARWGEVRVLRLVGGQGAAIRRAAARGFRRVRAEEGIQARLMHRRHRRA